MTPAEITRATELAQVTAAALVPEGPGPIRQAADQGDAEAQYQMGRMIAYGYGGGEAAARWFRLAAEQGHLAGLYWLGLMYEEGTGVPQDTREAMRWFRLAAEQGYSEAQQAIGIRYEQGRGVPKDVAEAIRWFRRAAEQGNPSAHYRLAQAYENGDGVLKDNVFAHMWYNISNVIRPGPSGFLRDNLERDMSRAAISRATDLARICMVSGYRDCGW